MTKLSKRMKEAGKLFKEGEVYTLEQAVENVEKFPKVKFDETVELHLFLNINPKSSDQSIRGTVVLPNGLGKDIKVAVFCKGELRLPYSLRYPLCPRGRRTLRVVKRRART